jgi:hypothetical protein
VLYNSFGFGGWPGHYVSGVKGQFEVLAGNHADPHGAKDVMKGCDSVLQSVYLTQRTVAPTFEKVVADYCGGLFQLTLWLLDTTTPDIRVNAISPGVYGNPSFTHGTR